MPLPVIASSQAERDTLHQQPMIRSTLALASQADVTFIGVGDLSEEAPLFLDGFISREELVALQKAGAVGEMVGWAFDAEGRIQGLDIEALIEEATTALQGAHGVDDILARAQETKIYRTLPVVAAWEIARRLGRIV